MERTFTVGLSLASLKQKIGCQCAWVDVTNMATLPPIVNPMKNADLDALIEEKIGDFESQFGGYVKDVSRGADVVKMTMVIEGERNTNWTKLAHLIEEYVMWRALVELYAPQSQAKHVQEWCVAESQRVESRLKQALCVN